MGGGTGSGDFVEHSAIRFPEGIFVRSSDIAEYYFSMVEKVASTALNGEIVAVQRNFDGERGRVLDVFKGGNAVAYIEQDYEDMQCRVYVADDEGMPVPLEDTWFAFDEASMALQQYIDKLEQ